MTSLFSRLLAGGALLALPASAPAAFNPNVVSADARWVVHVDLDTLRQTQLGQSLLGALQGIAPMFEHQHGVRPDFDKILQMAGSLTAYGSNLTQNPDDIDGTLVLQGTADLRAIAEGFIAQATVAEPEKVTEIKGLPFEAYSLDGQATLAFPQEKVILFSKSQEQLVKAHEVLRGAAPSLARQSTSVLGELVPREGAYFVVAATEIPTGGGMIPAHGPHARILQMATAGALALGEENNTTSARLQLMASSENMAEKLDRILVGMLAILSLVDPDDRELGELLRSVSSARKGKSVSISISYPSDRLVELIKTAHLHATERGREHAEAPHHDRDRDVGRADGASTDGLGQVIGAWHADADLPSNAPTPQVMTSRSFDGVALKNGAMLTIRGQRGGGEHARLDYVEIAPPAEGAPKMRYEAEFMRLENYQIEKLDFASGGELVRLRDNQGSGSVKFRYQGPEGTFRVIVGYVDENDGQSAFALGVDAATLEAPAAP